MSITVNNTPIKAFNFKAGECHVSIANIEIGKVTSVIAYLYSSDNIMQLMMIIDAIRRQSANTKIDLTVPYFPYARQDRVCNDGEAFSVFVMANMINSLECNSVTVYDPHSTITTDLINNVRVVSQSDILTNSVVINDIKEKGLVLASPDNGAAKKTQDFAEGNNIDVIYCTKSRDVRTGKITATNIPDGVEDKSFIIIDDICDGGRTFIELAKALKKAGANDLYLYVTHGIFSKGLDVLKESFIHVYCYHTFLNEPDIDSSYLTILEDS